MRIVHVYPIAKGVQKESLTYFSAIETPNGSVVSVPLRSKTTPAVVIKTEDVSEVKTALRGSEFPLKKIASKSARTLLFPSYITAILRASEYYATTPGALFRATMPTALFGEVAKLAEPKERFRENTSDVAPEKLVFQGTTEERYDHHKNLVREEFARKRSVLIVVPTVHSAETLGAFLAKGIPEYTIQLNGTLSTKELRTRWNKAVTLSHPVVIIMTSTFLSLPRGDIGTIVIEREGASAYKSLSRPFADARIIVEYLAEALHARLIVADVPLRVESVYRVKSGEFEERAPIRAHVRSTGASILIDMREVKSPDPKERFALISTALHDAITETLEAHENVFLFTARRGMAPLTVCDDCGNTVLCDITKTPVVLHKGPKGNVFVCHSCGAIRPADERCRFCNSWKLQTLGVGSELVEEWIRTHYGDTPLYILDKDRAKTHKEALRIGTAFSKARGAILIGTELAIPYLPKALSLSGIVSMDSLLSIPEWNAFERAFSILTRVRSSTTGRFMVQSRKPESEVLDFAIRGNANDFYKSELAMRKQFGYPPFTTFIKITCEGTSSVATEDMREVERMFAPFGFSGRSHLMHMGKGRYTIHGFLRIPRGEWPNTAITALLRTLPPHITVIIDPESIL